MERFLAVTDKDESYGKRLCGFISERKSVPFLPVSFTSAKAYLEFAKTHNVVLHIFDGETLEEFFKEYERKLEDEGTEGLEASDDIYGDYDAAGVEKLREELINERTVFLYKSKLLESSTEESLTEFASQGIYKYRSADEILRKAMDIYSRSTGRLKYVDNFAKTRIVGIYSPVSRCKKTTFALLLSEGYGRKGKALYINLEEFSGFSAFSGTRESEDLSDVLYYLKENSLDFPKLKSLVRRLKSFDYIPPVRYPDDTVNTEGRDYASLVESIADISDYEFIVIDMQGFSGGASELMEICDDIYMPVMDDAVSREKLDAFDRYMEESKRDRIAEKIKRIKLPEAEGTLSSDLFDRLIYSSVGDYVREMIS